MHLPPPPDSRQLLPPLLACLPTAFASPRPPPALLPQLSPVLRQRVTFLTSTQGSRSDGWLPLLSWDGERGGKLPSLVERMHLEPHPVSGELEMDDIRPAKYRRLDDETLHARLEVEQFEILPIYVWCETDEHGGSTEPGWKLAELRALEDIDDGVEWFDSIYEANDVVPTRRTLPAPQNGNHLTIERKPSLAGSDDDYWAAYDRTPGRTPGPKASPGPQPLSTFPRAPNRQRSVSELEYFARYGEQDQPTHQNVAAVRHPLGRQRSQSEFDYFSRYGNEVQPAMDAHDPDEEKAQAGLNTANRDSVLQLDELVPRSESRPTGASLFPADPATEFPAFSEIPAPRPVSAQSSHSSIERLEQRARAISEAQQSHASDYAQNAIKQHISTDIKSLFRLAKNTGIDRQDFERLVQRELECLSLLDDED